jgi:hypothetical protein
LSAEPWTKPGQNIQRECLPARGIKAQKSAGGNADSQPDFAGPNFHQGKFAKPAAISPGPSLCRKNTTGEGLTAGFSSLEN